MLYQFTKGSVVIMYEVALLRSRIAELEEANERLSKRRKLKKNQTTKRRFTFCTVGRGFSGLY